LPPVVLNTEPPTMNSRFEPSLNPTMSVVVAPSSL
jgi:hypothetical protein